MVFILHPCVCKGIHGIAGDAAVAFCSIWLAIGIIIFCMKP